MLPRRTDTMQPTTIGPALQFSREGGGFRLTSRLAVPHSRAAVFPFFADAFNLPRLIPPNMRFQVLTPAPIEMAEGLLIDYRLRVRGMPARWQSEISVWEPPYRFVDEQRRGPYKWWRHEHRFEKRGSQTIVIDDVSYGVPGGGIVNRLLVQPDLRRIFTHRTEVMKQLFIESSEGVTRPAPPPACDESGARRVRA